MSEIINHKELFRTVIENGDLEKLKWVCENFDLKIRNKTLFRIVAISGDLEKLKWLCENFYINTQQVIANNCYTLEKTIDYGHYDILKWICENFDIEKRHILYNDKHGRGLPLFAKTIFFRNYKVARWFCENFNIKKEEIEQDKIFISEYDLSNISLEDLKWICETLNINKDFYLNLLDKKTIKNKDVEKWLYNFVNNKINI